MKPNPLLMQRKCNNYASLVQMFRDCKKRRAWATYEKYLTQLDAIDHPDIKSLKKNLEAELKEATVQELIDEGAFEHNEQKN